MANTQAAPKSDGQELKLATIEDNKASWIRRQLSEEEKLRKQHQRLENEKRLTKLYKSMNGRLPLRHSATPKTKIESDSKELSVPDESSSTKSPRSSPASKLFDYEKSGPRSRRQLMEATSAKATSPDPHSAGGSVHGQSRTGRRDSTATKATHRDSLTPSDVQPMGRTGHRDSITTKTTHRDSLAPSDVQTMGRTGHRDSVTTKTTHRDSLAPSDVQTMGRTGHRDSITTRATHRDSQIPPDVQTIGSGHRDSITTRAAHRDSLAPSDVQTMGRMGHRDSVTTKATRRDSLTPSDAQTMGGTGHRDSITTHRDSLSPSTLHDMSRTGRRDSVTARETRRDSLTPSVTVNQVSGEKKVNFDANKLEAHLESVGSRSKSTSAVGPTTEKDAYDEDTERLKILYDAAIEKVRSIDESLLIEARLHPSSRSKIFSNSSFASGFDIATLKELETILNDARLFSSRRSSKEDHTRLDVSSNRAQKKRIQHLEKVLATLKPEEQHGHEDFDPYKILQCRYLRLSKSNIETLEEMCRQQGRDPGIHAHKDVTDYNIWEGLKEERRDSI